MKEPLCEWCRERPAVRRFCGRKCRQAAWRLRGRGELERGDEEPRRFAYADPPYPGLAKRYYQGEASYAGEVDHAKLINDLEMVRRAPREVIEASGVRPGLEGEPIAGWALSTSAAALKDVLALCPASAHVCAWVKPIAPAPGTYGLHNAWEPLIVVGGRRRRPGRRDWLSAQPARGGGELMGRKPLAFCAFLFGALGMQPGDELVDMFPGSGIVGRAWAEMSRPSLAPGCDADRAGLHASLAPRGDEAGASPGAATTRGASP